MKKGKSVKLTGFKSFKVSYGTVDYKNLKSIYLNIQSWVEPKDFLENAEKIIAYLIKRIKLSISDEYFQYLEKYQAKYGKKTVLLMQVGSFHEIYSCNIRQKNPEIYQIADILNLIVSRKDKSEPISESNHLMCGFPSVATSKFIKLLIDCSSVV